MDNYNFCNPTRIVFGKGAEAQTGKLVKQYGGAKVLLHYGGGSIKKNGVYDKVVASLKAEGVSYVELGGVQPNPRLSLAREGAELCKKEGVDFILAVGGGSAIDSAKCISVAVKSDRDVWDYYMDPSIPIGETVPVASVLTIPAAGSESSISSVITNDENWYKRSIDQDAIIPKFAVINPETNYTLPPYQTACGCSDIMAHLMERYFTNVKDVDSTDRLIEACLRTIINFAPRALREPDNYNYRAEINFTGTLAHNGLLNCGRIGDWGSHVIEHELSGAYDVAHGAGLSVIFPAWMRYVYKHDVDRFIQFAVRVFDVDLAFAHREAIALEGIRRLESFFQSIGLPTRLSELNIGEDRLEEMAEKCVDKRGTVGQFIPLGKDDVVKIYRLAL